MITFYEKEDEMDTYCVNCSSGFGFAVDAFRS